MDSHVYNAAHVWPTTPSRCLFAMLRRTRHPGHVRQRRPPSHAVRYYRFSRQSEGATRFVPTVTMERRATLVGSAFMTENESAFTKPGLKEAVLYSWPPRASPRGSDLSYGVSSPDLLWLVKNYV
ncbi:hypothetical protein MTO96_005344 [Rhipicephalus appendiculatus]